MNFWLAILAVLIISLSAYRHGEPLWPWQPRCKLSRVDADFNRIGADLKAYKESSTRKETERNELPSL